MRTGEQAEAEFALFLREPTAYRPKRQQFGARLGADSLSFYRIIVFKAFCSWLRAQGLLDEDSDPSRPLKVPASRPERAVRTKGYPKAVVEALYAGLGSQAIRDVLCPRVKAGIHGSEIERISSGGAEVRRLPSGAPIASTVRFAHKSGRIHTVSLDLQATAAALRLQVRGKAPTRTAIQESVARVCKRLGLPKIHFGELRHSFVAWALEVGPCKARPID